MMFNVPLIGGTTGHAVGGTLIALLFGPNAACIALYCPYDLSISIPAMMIPHLAVAGVVEAVFTVAVYAFVRKTAPDLTYENILASHSDAVVAGAGQKKTSHVPVFALIAVLIAADITVVLVKTAQYTPTV